MKKIDIRRDLKRQKYGLVGEHSAVQVCHWAKNSLRGKSGCWKEKFYGIKSHKCCQASVSLFNCENKCVHCWRNTEYSIPNEVENPEDPEKIINGLIEERKKLLMGFGGNNKTLKKKFQDALMPSLFTFSLTGEATLYPRLGEMIKLLREKNIITFLVTNGQNPEAILKLEEENNLPTQLTVSTNAPNEELFRKWHNSAKKDAWKKFNETLKVIANLKGKCRRCVRLTLVRPGKEGYSALNGLTNMTDELVPQYVEMINKAQPDFIHVKGYTSIGHARARMGYDKMPWFKDVKEYAKKILKELRKADVISNSSSSVSPNGEWKILGLEERSCVVVIGKSKKNMKIKKA